MREIKFRAKENGNGKWIYGTYRFVKYRAHDGKEINQHTIQGELSEWLIDTSTIGQYTGLKDKNGIEIYEGDVIGGIQINGSYCYCEIVWSTGAFLFAQLGGEYLSRTAFGINESQCEIIGNIHDNKELLDAED